MYLLLVLFVLILALFLVILFQKKEIENFGVFGKRW